MITLPEVRLFESKCTYIAIFAGFFLLEALLSLWTGLSYDMEVWFNTGAWMNQGINIYEPPHHLGYPPLWALWCFVAFRLYSFFGNNYEIWHFVIKLPNILAHLGLAYSIGVFAANRFNRKTGLKIFFITLTGSFFIYIGAMWGQINTLSALLTFLAFYAVINQRTRVSALLLGTAITLKIYPLVPLPAFLAYVLRNSDRKETGRFLIYACAVPVLFTGLFFTVFQWDILLFLKTIFYSTPVFEDNPVQILQGAMNIWSFFALHGVDLVKFWFFRLLWIPILGAGAFFWIRKNKMDEQDLNFSIVSLYILFMISYSWVSEQLFLDPLPFIFLLIFAYRPRRLYLYFLVVIQILIYAFSVVNWGPSIFEPIAERFFPSLLQLIWFLDPSKSSQVWYVRGTLGLIISTFLSIFLLILWKPEGFKRYLSILLSKLKRSRTIEEFTDRKQMSA
jgi:Gpi18-like mannosyltransferase